MLHAASRHRPSAEGSIRVRVNYPLFFLISRLLIVVAHILDSAA
jgi:hypothetical protein